MSKILLSLPSAWSKCLPLLYQRQRHFASEIKGSWNEAPLCKEEHKISKAKPKCHPKQVSCAGSLSACGRSDWPKCGEPDIKPPTHLTCCCDRNLSKPPCEPPAKKKHKHNKQEDKPFISMWETCGVEEQCPALIPRLDETHYESSDKRKRVYTQTWKSCEPVVRKRKVCCFNEMCMLPPLVKRPKCESPQTAKEKDSEQLKLDYNVLKKCMEKPPENPNTRRINKCHKINMPCCRKVAAIIKCHRNRMRSKCLKECCPHPSFSECQHPKLKKGPPVECRCLHFVNQCETNRFAIRKKQFNIPPALPAWPPKERPK
ncbi:hypothetical protein FF38_00517 [Lucilia cuprina]|uniref:Uncharacterized protein n=1 Tax=Lucilia cuprina TaxID=7375 RepID=A0A0L0CT00_LUCCU|nr:hypothetical protein FF38_00517 [Lucilia cuprina]